MGMQIYALLSSLLVLLISNVLKYKKSNLFFFENLQKTDFTTEVTTNVRTGLSCKQFHNKMSSRKTNVGLQETSKQQKVLTLTRDLTKERTFKTIRNILLRYVSRNMWG